jgi:hypothetical protein
MQVFAEEKVWTLSNRVSQLQHVLAECINKYGNAQYCLINSYLSMISGFCVWFSADLVLGCDCWCRVNVVWISNVSTVLTVLIFIVMWKLWCPWRWRRNVSDGACIKNALVNFRIEFPATNRGRSSQKAFKVGPATQSLSFPCGDT